MKGLPFYRHHEGGTVWAIPSFEERSQFWQPATDFLQGMEILLRHATGVEMPLMQFQAPSIPAVLAVLPDDSTVCKFKVIRNKHREGEEERERESESRERKKQGEVERG